MNELGLYFWLSGDHRIALLKRFKNPKIAVAAADIKALNIQQFWYDFWETEDQVYDEFRWNL